MAVAEADRPRPAAGDEGVVQRGQVAVGFIGIGRVRRRAGPVDAGAPAERVVAQVDRLGPAGAGEADRLDAVGGIIGIGRRPGSGPDDRGPVASEFCVSPMGVPPGRRH